MILRENIIALKEACADRWKNVNMVGIYYTMLQGLEYYEAK